MLDIDTLLKQVKRIHFIGIGGSGMCPLAEILHSEGYEITGSDNNTGDTVDKLRSLGIPVIIGQKPENIAGAQLIIYTAAILDDNPELVAAKKSGIPIFERAVLFGAISRLYPKCICVCGTHGKTTVTSLLTQILIMAGKDPTAVIGGKLALIDSHGRVGHSDTMVCEACEFGDHYHQLSPSVSVVLNIDADHLDYFGSLENIIKSFRKFVNMTSDTIIYNGDDKNTLEAVEGVEKKKITFGFSDINDYYPMNITYIHGVYGQFDVMHEGKKLAHLALKIPGKHNILNALAAFAAAVNAGVTSHDCERATAQFAGAGRRFELYGTYKGITIFDDYAHHPTELEATLNTIAKMGFNRVWAVFQPFTYSRTKRHLDEFARVLQIPEKCVMTEIMGSREVNDIGIYTKDLAEKIPGSVWFEGFDGVVDYVIKNAKPGDAVITLGCGDIYKAAKMMVQRLQNT